MLLVIGPKRSGKGTIVRVLRGLIGPPNFCGPTFFSIGTNFGLWPLLGKTVAAIPDARISGRTATAAVLERLLSISGEDAQTVDRKNLPPVTTKLLTRFVICTNELPRLADSSGAFAGRFLTLRLSESWYGKEDPGLTARRLAERPGILLWAIQGWQRLREGGKFVQPASGQELVDQLLDLSSPMGAFVRECCDLGPAHAATVADLYRGWELWCRRNGCKEPGDHRVFGRDLLAAFPSVRSKRPGGDGKRPRAYQGIALNTSWSAMVRGPEHWSESGSDD